ncbi:hypothetical protein AYI70_g10295 [Smittium culicis]|uniref:Uncharacterized protein n=1 Tax=Smittium culicis TaxID=133412 RepID=A0A1R1X7A0_9FUNG|nr:hypothetical protein AYI70_g10295 [Smittium culicis]
MVIRKPVKRASTLFSDVMKGNDPQYSTNEVQNSNTTDYTRANNQHRLNHDPRSQLNNKKMQKRSAKKTLTGKKGNLTDMSMYKEVSIEHMLLRGEMNCLKKFCTDGSDVKVGCSWAQFKGNHIDTLEDISAWRRFDNNQYLPYGIKVLLKNNNMEIDLPSFLDHENVADEIPPSPIEKVSSGDDTESDGSTDDNNQPLIKRTTKSTINSDDSYDISMDSDTSSPMEIKIEFISPNPSPMKNSDGYRPPSEHALTAAKARVEQISG